MNSNRLVRLRTKLLFAAIGLFAVASVAWLLANPTSAQAVETPAAPPATKVTVAPVEQRLITEYEEITGHIDATETVELRARVSGHLDAVHFAAGQIVKKGDVLFTIDPRWYQAQYDLTKARAELADSEAKRADALLADQAISSEDVEARHAAAAEAKALMESARLDLDYTQVRAPITGRISRALVTEGNLVAGTPGNATQLATIVTVGEAYVYADVDETTLLKFNRLVHDGKLVTQDGRIPVDLELTNEDNYPRHGFIESADNRVNPGTGSLVLRMVFPNADGALIPGLFARVRVPISQPESTLLISEESIGTDQSQKFVLAVGKDNTVSYRTVKLGGTYEDKRIVREGVAAGDEIITRGLQHVRPGMTVAPEVAVATDTLLTKQAQLAATR